MPLRPTEVHPEQHLRPVGRLGTAGARADREDGAAAVVLAGEQQERALTLEVPGEGRDVAGQLRLEVRIGRLAQQLGELRDRGRASFEPAPGGDLVAEALGLSQDLLRGALVVPEARFEGERVELLDAALLGLEVKDAPRSTGSARRDPGWRRNRGSIPGLEILEQDRTELDQPQGGLAPGDDGVHAGAVAVVGAHATVAVTVEGGRIAAGSAVTLAGDEIGERGFLNLLHDGSLSLALGRSLAVGGRAATDLGRGAGLGLGTMGRPGVEFARV
jgi:hypothetical protein